MNSGCFGTLCAYFPFMYEPVVTLPSQKGSSSNQKKKKENIQCFPSDPTPNPPSPQKAWSSF